MTKYEYMVSYACGGGIGRVFVTRTQPIESAEQVESVEKSISHSKGGQEIAMQCFQLLRSYQDETAAKERP